MPPDCEAKKRSINYLSIYKKVREVEKVFNMLNQHIAVFQKESNLGCLASCGKCCSKADIEASVLEFLPLAYHLYKEKKALEVLEMLQQHDSGYCVILQPFLGQGDRGFCANYKYRGLICRLFGFSARRDKYGSKNLVTCKTIKESQSAEYNEASNKISLGEMDVPMMSNYSMMLNAIDFQLASRYYPINTAIKMAIENVLSYYSYRSKWAG